MPPCFVRKDTSPTYQRSIDRLKKQFPHIEEDIDSILVDIAQDYRHARNADSVMRFNNKLFKYRAPCRDQARGSRGGFRVCGFYDEPTNTLHLILVWPKSEADDLDYESKNKAVQELLQVISTKAKAP
jgi:hypothetical protein